MAWLDNRHTRDEPGRQDRQALGLAIDRRRGENVDARQKIELALEVDFAEEFDPIEQPPVGDALFLLLVRNPGRARSDNRAMRSLRRSVPGCWQRSRKASSSRAVPFSGQNRAKLPSTMGASGSTGAARLDVSITVRVDPQPGDANAAAWNAVVLAQSVRRSVITGDSERVDVLIAFT